MQRQSKTAKAAIIMSAVFLSLATMSCTNSKQQQTPEAENNDSAKELVNTPSATLENQAAENTSVAPQRNWAGKYMYEAMDGDIIITIKGESPYTVTYEFQGAGDGNSNGKAEVTNQDESSIEVTFTTERGVYWDCNADDYVAGKEKALKPSAQNRYTIVEKDNNLYIENNGHSYKAKKK